MSSIAEAVAAWQQQKISGSALMREIVSYKQWSVPVSEEAAGEVLREGVLSRLMFHQDQEGISRLSIFSDGPAYVRFCQAVGEADSTRQTFLGVTGTWLFQLPLDAIDIISIDPATPPDIHYRKEQFPRLRSLAEAIDVEEALAALRSGENTTEGMLKLVRDYSGYLIAVHQTGDSNSLALAPDSQGRALAAVFTFEDAFEAYYPEGKQMYPEGELLALSLSGEELFTQLQEMNLTGMVFNCSGPTRPVAFAAPFAQVVLQAG